MLLWFHVHWFQLLRSSLVNNRTQAIICDDLGMTQYVINNDQLVKERISNEHNKVKDKADIVEGQCIFLSTALQSFSPYCFIYLLYVWGKNGRERSLTETNFCSDAVDRLGRKRKWPVSAAVCEVHARSLFNSLSTIQISNLAIRWLKMLCIKVVLCGEICCLNTCSNCVQRTEVCIEPECLKRLHFALLA